MTYLGNFFVGVSLFISSLFGYHHAVVATTSITASSSISVTTAATSAPVKPSSLLITDFANVFAKKPIATPTIQSAAPINGAVTAATQAGIAAVPTNSAAAPDVQPAPSPIGTASIGQNEIISSSVGTTYDDVGEPIYTSVKLQGNASSVSEVAVAFATLSSNATDWNSISGAPNTRLVIATISNGTWLVNLKGLVGGTYKVLVYDTTPAHDLLASGTVEVTAALPLIRFVTDPSSPVTIGIGQITSDGSVSIKLLSLNAGSSPLAIFSVTSEGEGPTSYAASSGESVPQTTTGFMDSMSPSCAVSFKVSTVSSDAKTATLIFSTAPEVQTKRGTSC